jgi:DNA-binding response OmpR family regulator
VRAESERLRTLADARARQAAEAANQAKSVVLAAGMDDYVAKPIRATALVRVLKGTGRRADV